MIIKKSIQLEYSEEQWRYTFLENIKDFLLRRMYFLNICHFGQSS